MMTVDQFVDRLEGLTSDIQTSPEGNMWQYAIERLVEDLRTELAGTELANTLGYRIEGSLVGILAADYLMYQNYGVGGAEGNPKGAMGDEFDGGRTHSFGTDSKMPYPGLFARYASDESHQFAIAKNIRKFGIRPKGWFTKAELESDYVEYVEDFITNELLRR